jgi:5-methylcytosine-specific restriction endonuclease McrA
MKVQKLLDGITNKVKFTKMSAYIGSRDRIREIIRIHHNHTCEMCGKVWEIGMRRFDIHHKDCDKDKTKQIDRNEDLDNLICLCHKCHLNLPEHRKAMSESHNQPVDNF